MQVWYSDNYGYLVDDCKSIRQQGFYAANIKRIETYAEIGERIVGDPLYQKHGKGNGEFMERLFSDIGIHKTSGYNAIQFYEQFIQGKFESVSAGVESLILTTKEGHEISWHIVKAKYLPKPKTEEPEVEGQESGDRSIAASQEEIIRFCAAGKCDLEVRCKKCGRRVYE